MVISQKNLQTFSIDDAIEIGKIGLEFGQFIQQSRTYPMDTTKLNELLERMKPYKEIFESCVESSRIELNKLHPYPSSFGKPRFNYKIPA